MNEKIGLFAVSMVLVAVSTCVLQAQSAALEEGKSAATKKEASLFDNVVSQLESGFYDKDFRKNQLPGIVKQYQNKADQAETLEDERRVVHQMLSRIPSSHMGLLSKHSYEKLIGELFNRVEPTFGFEIMEFDGMHYAHNVLEGGPADKAGLKPGDRLLLIDDQLVEESLRLDWRTDDAYLPDPPVRYLLTRNNESVQLTVDRGKAHIETIGIDPAPYSAFMAAESSARIIEYKNTKVGYIHFWFIHVSGVSKLLKQKLEGEFAECDAVILDLRGRGGSAGAIQPIINVLNGKNSTWSGSTIALVDRNTRSAKEVLSFLLQKESVARIVGQRTAGAVIPATFKDVGQDTMLMFPTFSLGKHTDNLEGIGVKPDVLVEDWRPFRGGKDLLIIAGLDESVLEVAKQKVGQDTTDQIKTQDKSNSTDNQ